MKPVYQRIIAIIIMCVPGALAIYGWTLMRDVLFNYFGGQGMAWLPFIGGLVLLIVGLALIGGFLFHHDRKRKRIQPRLIGKQNDPTYRNKPGY
ncbi:hypothetical protein ADL26_00315 [Thermoactinomyces vulgaris]|jgi:hypothetical protein|nr:hypothetical protein ADL26_00315 [Thermoactinomyces vulgaris]